MWLAETAGRQGVKQLRSFADREIRAPAPCTERWFVNDDQNGRLWRIKRRFLLPVEHVRRGIL